ncbi:MAG: hypothetical protein HYV32_00355 [Candidatus Kerfeldbacteria bacterium]|nr:hypothetical protein [Candidatus Kerfeldbacteria bacterium]
MTTQQLTTHIQHIEKELTLLRLNIAKIELQESKKHVSAAGEAWKKMGGILKRNSGN